MPAAIASGVTQGTDEWRAFRTTGITSTDAAIIAGESGSIVELWAQKRGMIEVEAPDAALAGLFEWGHRLEPIIADWYSDTTGRRLRRVNELQIHPEVPWAYASLDRVAIGERRIVEIKSTRRGWEPGEKVPGKVQVQVQHQLWVMGYDVADVAVLTGGSSPTVYEIPRDDAFIDNLVFLEREFWDWWQSGTRPPMDGSENARRTLARMHPRNDGTFLPPDAETDRLFFDWMAARVAKDEADAAADTLANALRAVIGDADGIEGRVTWKRNKDSTRTDWPSVAAAYRTLLTELGEYTQTGSFLSSTGDVRMVMPADLDTLQSIHTSTVEGARVLRPVKGPIE